MNATPPQPAPGTAPIGRWLLTAVPDAWTFVPGFGLRSPSPTPSPASLLLTEDVLPGGTKLAPYLQSQNKLLALTYPLTQIAGPAPAQVPGAGDAQMLILKHPASTGGDVFQIQTYALAGRWIGIVTLTSTPQELPSARVAMNEVLAGLQILPEPPTPPANPSP
jgi:hypothetical protein